MSIWRLMATGSVGVLACIGGALVNPVAAADCYLAPSSLIAWWPLNGASTDVRGNNAATFFGSPEYGPAKVGSGLRFDGVDDYVRVPASAGINISRASNSQNSQQFAIELWMNPAHTNPQPVLEWNNGLGTNGVSLWIEAGGKLTVRFDHPNGSGNDVLASAPGAVAANVFQHVGISYSPNFGFGASVALWLNGKVVASAQTSSQGNIKAETGYDLYFGYRPSGAQAGARFTGVMDEVSFYSSYFGGSIGLYEAGILGVYQAGEAGKCLSCAAPPSISALSASQIINNGTTLILSPTVTGTRPLSYQWRFNGTNIPNAVSPSYVITNMQVARSGDYSLMVTGFCGTASSTGLVTALPGPQIITQPRHQGLLPGETANFSVQATGPDLTYLWRHNGAPLLGQTAGTLAVPAVQAMDAGDYSVVVANSYYSVTSAVAKLLVGRNALDCDVASLRRAVEFGGYYSFQCDATIVVTNSMNVTNDLYLDAGGHAVTISGGGSHRMFQVNSNVHFSLTELTLTDGKADRGGAIFNEGGVLDLRQVTFRGNQAVALGNANGSEALGGAIFSTNGIVLASRCHWEDNSALGAHASIQYIGFTSRRPSSAGRGGAIFNAGGTVRIEGSLFRNNHARGGSGISDMSFAAWGSDGEGGAINNRGSMVVLNSTFDHNGALGGTSQNNAAAQFSLNGLGGGMANLGALFATNCTLSGNYVQGGTNGYAWPGSPADGEGKGGGLYAPTGSVTLNHVSFSGNKALPSHSGAGKGASIFAAGSVVRLVNSILVSGQSGSNCFGALIDDGHNISSDASCNFTSAGSLNNTDPRLGPLADNGGPTPTLALLPGSPAINAADDTACATIDQRGVSRPQFEKCDIGAFEARLADLPPVLVVSAVSPQAVTLLLHGAPGVEYRLLSSSGLASWSSIATNIADASGATSFSVPVNGAAQFYRAIMP